MVLDPETVRVAATLGLAAPSAVFVAATTQRHNDPASRLWAVGLLVTCAALGVSFLSDGSDLDTGLTAVVGAAAVLGPLTIWMGARLLHARTAGWSVAAVVGVVLAVAAVVAPEPARLLQLCGGVLIAVLCFVEFGRGATRTYVEARIVRALMVVLGVLCLGGILRQLVGDVPGIAASDWRILSGAALFQVTISVALSALREGEAERTVGARIGRTTVAGLLTAADFVARADDQVARADVTGENTTLLIAQVDELDALETAYGSQAREAAVVHVSTVLRAHLSASTLLGYLGSGRFGVLVVHQQPTTDADERLRAGLLSSPPPDVLPLRMAVTVDVVATGLDPALLREFVPIPRKLV